MTAACLRSVLLTTLAITSLAGCSSAPLVRQRIYVGTFVPKKVLHNGVLRMSRPFEMTGFDANLDALLAPSSLDLVAVVNTLEPGDPPRVWTSSDRGGTWAAGPSVGALTGDVTGAVVSHSRDSKRRQLIVAGYLGLARCDLASGEVEAVLEGAPVHEVAADSHGEVILCLLEDGSMKLSRDAGRTWDEAGAFTFDRGVTGPGLVGLAVGPFAAYAVTWQAVYRAPLGPVVPLEWTRVATVTHPLDTLEGPIFDDARGRLYWIDQTTGVPALQVFHEADGTQETLDSLGALRTATVRRSTGTVYAINTARELVSMTVDGSCSTLGWSNDLDERQLLVSPGSSLYATDFSEDLSRYGAAEVD